MTSEDDIKGLVSLSSFVHAFAAGNHHIGIKIVVVQKFGNDLCQFLQLNRVRRHRLRRHFFSGSVVAEALVRFFSKDRISTQ
jgi:hypothetical protein